MAKKQKYYVVWKGVSPGVYHSWTDCQLQIKGYEVHSTNPLTPGMKQNRRLLPLLSIMWERMR